MAQVMIRCPKSKMPVPTGISMSKAAFESSTLENNSIGPCPDCEATHTWSKSEAFVLGDDD